MIHKQSEKIEHVSNNVRLYFWQCMSMCFPNSACFVQWHIRHPCLHCLSCQSNTSLHAEHAMFVTDMGNTESFQNIKWIVATFGFSLVKILNKQYIYTTIVKCMSIYTETKRKDKRKSTFHMMLMYTLFRQAHWFANHTHIFSLISIHIPNFIFIIHALHEAQRSTFYWREKKKFAGYDFINLHVTHTERP